MNIVSNPTFGFSGHTSGRPAGASSGATSKDSSDEKTQVYIVDDHVLIRYALAKLISAEEDMEVCGQAEDAVHGLQDIMRLRPHVAIVDISLKGNSGLELIKSIRAYSTEIRILVVSMHPDSLYGMRALNAGARGYVMKQDDVNKVVTAIRRLREGGICVSDEVADQMLNRSATRRSPGDTSFVRFLSDRELEVVNLIGNGLTTREIAVKLHVSVKTVETHRGHIKEKLNLANASQLVQSCVRWVDENNAARHAPSALGAA
jgi:DNA-binding NarL/FixJ family response regulator